MTAEDWVQAFGTVVTFVGLVAVAPAAVGGLARTVWTACQRFASWVLRGFKREPKTSTVEAGTRYSESAPAYADYVIGTANETELERLAREVQQLRSDLEASKRSVAQLAESYRTSVDRLSADVSQVQSTIRSKHAEEARLNARGFPLAAVGTLVAGAPFWFMSWFWLFALIPILLLFGRRTMKETWDGIRGGFQGSA